MRFLLSRRWVLFFLVVVLLACATYLLGRWQFHRLTERKASNAVITGNLHRPAAPAGRVLAPGRAVPDSSDYRHVRARGRYDEQHTVVIRYQTRDGAAGVDVVTPLVTRAGPALLVDRGWLASDNLGSDRPDIPAAPQGTVTVDGWVRQDDTSDASVVTDGSARTISSAAIRRTVPYPVYRGFVDLHGERPAPAQRLAPAEPPDLSNGPHFFYGLQWWFFGLLAVFGFCYFAYDEWRARRRGDTSIVQRHTGHTGQADQPGQAGSREPYSERSMPPSTGSITPEMNDEAGDSRNVAARPNSSGRP